MSNRSRFQINTAKEDESLRLKSDAKRDDCIRERVKQERNSELKQVGQRFFQEGQELQQVELDDNYERSQLLNRRQQEQEEMVAREVNHLKNKEFVLQKRRQQLIDETPELRDLKSTLQLIQAKKEQSNQIAEKQLAKLKKQEVASYQRAISETVWRSEEERRKISKCEERLSKMKVQDVLKEQMIEKEETKRELYADFLKEKLLADDVTRVVHEEDQRLWTEKMEKMQKTKEEMLEFQRAREIWRKKDEESLKAENIRLMQFIIEKGQKEEYEALLLKNKADSNEAAKQEVARILTEKMGEDEEHDQILEELMVAELEAKVDKRHREDVERAMHDKIATRQTLLMQMQERADRLKHEESQDHLRRQQLIKQMSEEANLDAYAREKQRIMKLQFGMEATKMIEERKLRRAQELYSTTQEDQDLMDDDMYRMRLIEEERIRILKLHASLFSENLPRGVLRESDLPHLGPDFVAAFSPVKKGRKPACLEPLRK